MQLRRFRGRDMNLVMGQVTDSLGVDAMILRTSEMEPFAGYGSVIEVVAAAGSDVDRLRRTLFTELKDSDDAADLTRSGEPKVIAFVGPPGSGKTTALLKLLAQPWTKRDLSVGVLTLDTYRAGALDEMLIYAGTLGARLEIAYTEREINSALKRLRSVDVILVDTPGRGGGRFDDRDWEVMLERLRPDEIHLVLSAALRMDVATDLRDRFKAMNPSHLLLTHLDELRGDVGLTDLMLAVGLPSRWVGDGAGVEHGLIPAERRAFSALGLSAPVPEVRLEAV
ncbi:MAG: hypothetical protein ACR2QM_02535 [Longimicrobiales bacterium]